MKLFRGAATLLMLTLTRADAGAVEEEPFDAKVLDVRPRVFLRDGRFQGLTIEKLRTRIDEPGFASVRKKWRARPLGRGLLWLLEGRE